MNIIAECGCNFRSMEEAKQMIDECRKLELFACKFQIYDSSLIKDHPQREFLESIKIDFKRAKELFEYGKSIGQEVFFTPMFEKAVDWCEQVGVNYYKIRAKDNVNASLLKKVFDTKKICFLSCTHSMRENYYCYHKQIIPLYCVPKYPATFEDYHPNQVFYWCKGISDHTPDLKRLLMNKKCRNRDHYVNFYTTYTYYEYWEKHVKLDGTTPLEDAWSTSFSELKEVLSK